MTLPDYVSALLTADSRTQPDDGKYRYRTLVTQSFARYGIAPAPTANPDGTWKAPNKPVSFERCHFESMQRDADEVFRFVWENRDALDVDPAAYTSVQTVRPCVRVSVDGFVLRETVAEYVQVLQLRADELKGHGIRAPDGMPGSTKVTLQGGGTMVFDGYGQLKFHVGSAVTSEKQSARIQHLWDSGAYREGQAPRRFAQIHRLRAMGGALVNGGHAHGWH